MKKMTFAVVRAANMARIPRFLNARGERAHTSDDGSDWALSKWMNAVHGECGEAANLIKKYERGDLTMDELRPKLIKELADIVHYVDILAYQLRADLGEAVADKFNEISRRIDVPIYIRSDRSGLIIDGTFTVVDTD